jgi:uncharacterized membrane protein
MTLEDPEQAPPAQETTKSSIGRRLRAYLLAGVLVTAPITLTIYLTYLFLSFVDAQVVGLLPLGWYERYYAHTTVPGIGLLVALTFFISVGWLATNFFGRTVIRMSEYIVNKMPVIRTVHAAIKQIFETVMTPQGQGFRQAVMVEFPRKDIWSIGFVTGRTEGEVQRLTEDEVINVFVPTTPNPTSGYLLFMPKKDIVYLEMSVEDALKMIISAGIITPPDKKKRALKGK